MAQVALGAEVEGVRELGAVFVVEELFVAFLRPVALHVVVGYVP